MNGDGARWIKNITSKGAISQKDNFHIYQEIVRDIADKQYREELEKIIEGKRFDEVQKYIENLKSELGGEEKTVKKNKQHRANFYVSMVIMNYNKFCQRNQSNFI